MDTFGERILPQVIQQIQLSAYRARKLRPSARGCYSDSSAGTLIRRGSSGTQAQERDQSGCQSCKECSGISRCPPNCFQISFPGRHAGRSSWLRCPPAAPSRSAKWPRSRRLGARVDCVRTLCLLRGPVRRINLPKERRRVAVASLTILGQPEHAVDPDPLTNQQLHGRGAARDASAGPAIR
jgi:hypothetical protein